MGLGRLLFLCFIPVALTLRGQYQSAEMARRDRPSKKNLWELSELDADGCLMSCANISAHELRLIGKDMKMFASGCGGDAFSRMEQCSLGEGEFEQSGGHQGKIIKLTDNRVGKMADSFTPGGSESDARRGRVELEAYAEMWCLARLTSTEHKDASLKKKLAEASLKQRIEKHALLGLVRGHFASEFYGLCTHKRSMFMVLDNLKAGYQDPCEVDLKLAYNVLEPDAVKRLGQDLNVVHAAMPDPKKVGYAAYKTWTTGNSLRGPDSLTPGVRPAGFTVKSPYTGQKVQRKEPSLIMDKTAKLFGSFFASSGREWDASLFTGLNSKLLPILDYWKKRGDNSFRAVGMSTLMLFECKPIGPKLDINKLSVRGFKMGHAKFDPASISVRAMVCPTGSLCTASRTTLEPSPKSWKSWAAGMVIDSIPFVAQRSGALRDGWHHSFGNRDVTEHPSLGFSFTFKSFKKDGVDLPDVQRQVEAGRVHPEVLPLDSLTLSFTGERVRAGRTGKHEEAENYGSVVFSLSSSVTGPHCSKVKEGIWKGSSVCIDIAEGAYSAAKPVKMPSVTLVDFAHFYPADKRRDWPKRDGVLQGLQSINNELDQWHSLAVEGPTP